MNRKSNIVILHGFTGLPTKNWLPWFKHDLESRGYEVCVPELPNTNFPKESEQVAHALENCKIDEQTILIGHSLGGVVALKIVEGLSFPIAGLVLVAPVMEREFFTSDVNPQGKKREYLTTFSLKVDHKIIVQNTAKRMILQADNDDPDRAVYLQYLSARIDAKIYATTSEKPHFCGEQEPFIKRRVDELLESLEA